MARRQWVNDVDRQWRENDWPAAEASAAFMSMIRAASRASARMRPVLKPFSMNVTSYYALVWLEFQPDGAMLLTKLAKGLLISPTRLTYVIDGLQNLGYVRRVSDPSDRRATLATITPEGRAAVREATEAVSEVRFGVGNLDDRDARTLVRLLAIVTDEESTSDRPDAAGGGESDSTR